MSDIRSAWSMFFTEKPELKLALMDEIMYKHKRFQTKKDWEIEVEAGNTRRNSYLAAFVTYYGMFLWTAPVQSVKRFFGPPDSIVIPIWRMGKDAIRETLLGLNGVRPHSTGLYRQLWCVLPSFLVLSSMNHYAQCVRFSSYLSLKNETTFGELAAKIDDGSLVGNSPIFGKMDGASADVIRTPEGKMQLTFL